MVSKHASEGRKQDTRKRRKMMQRRTTVRVEEGIEKKKNK
jgi:hypothetical protein